MSRKLVEKTKNSAAKIYVVGILVFSAIFGFITLLSIFLRQVEVN